jgi:O-antigen/teichoic acid export membrane protein
MSGGIDQSESQLASRDGELRPTVVAASLSTVPPRLSVIALVGHMVGANLASMVLSLVGGFLQARLLAPAILGLFNGIGLALRYAPFLQLGVLDGLYRELPYHIGRGDRQRAEALASVAQGWALIVGSVYAIALLGVGGWHLAHGRSWMAAGWSSNAILALVFYYKTYYLQLTYRTAQDFSRLALVAVVESMASVVLLILVAWLNFYGLCLRALLVGALGTGMLFLWRPIRVRPTWNVGHLKHLLLVGLPIFSVGQTYSWWSVLDSTLVLKFAGLEGMGLYAMVTMANAAIEFIPSASSQVLYPRMAEEYGKALSVSKVVRIALRPMILTTIALAPVVAVAWGLAGPF